jgi:hypothetical protein
MNESVLAPTEQNLFGGGGLLLVVTRIIIRGELKSYQYSAGISLLILKGPIDNGGKPTRYNYFKKCHRICHALFVHSCLLPREDLFCVLVDFPVVNINSFNVLNTT